MPKREEWIKYLINWGLGAVFAGYLLFVEVPNARQESLKREQILTEREDKRLNDWKAERRESFNHAKEAISELGSKHEKIANEIKEMNRNMDDHQKAIRHNLETLIEVNSINKPTKPNGNVANPGNGVIAENGLEKK